MSNNQTQTTYWKSLNELSQNEEYEKFLHREFPENATELTDQTSRRSFLRIMGASIALAGFAACRRPVQNIMPYSRMPEDVVEGRALYYATSMPFQGSLTGLIAENNEGRPTKLEGNGDHPASNGNTNIYHQASILSMYDPDRSRSPRQNSEAANRSEFITFAGEHFADTNRSVAFISEANSSPTYNRLREEALNRFTGARWVTFEPFGEENALEGARMAFGRRLRTVYHFDNADLVVSLDSDFLNPAFHSNNVQYAGGFSSRRHVASTEDDMSRVYAVESTFSMTGSSADHRLRLKASQIEPFTYALAARLSQSVSGLDAFAAVQNEFSGHEWLEVLAADLLSRDGNSLLTAGAEQSPSMHAAVAAINLALGNSGNTVTWHDVPHMGVTGQYEEFQRLIGDIQAGDIDTVVIIGANPVFTAPSDLDVASALNSADTVIHLSDYVDETSAQATWHVNRAHFLEAWGDGYSYAGTRSIIQPQVQPLHNGMSEIEFLQLINSGEWADGYSLVQETWQGFFLSDFESRWNRTLHDGLVPDSAFPSVSVTLTADFNENIGPALSASAVSGLEIVIKPHSTIYDGRFANNGWLMELPEPMTKITWDNVALVSPATARTLGIPDERSLGDKDAPVIRIETERGAVEIAAWVQPGHADDTITLTAGHGRSSIGRVADGAGVDTYPLRGTDSMYYQQGTVSLTGRNYEIACVQDHNSLEGRDMIREATLDEYRENPNFADFFSIHGYDVPAIVANNEFPSNLYADRTFPAEEPQWGMAIDLNTCFGCGVCTIACQAENNIPVIGKQEVGRRRMMHWIRTDRYYEGDENNPRALHQPVPCMHCEQAPCEQVCPVAATTHSPDGMNQMTYNRCIGTRYCSNNCPYKVRRFNFFNYSKEFLTTGDDPEIIQMAMNPEVTVRFRGVMEKCTYCVQRVNRAKIEAKKETGSPRPADGVVQTACQQACPANAIAFGDTSDPDTEVSRIKANNRNYSMLEELNTRPRTTYLAKLNNPNPDMV